MDYWIPLVKLPHICQNFSLAGARQNASYWSGDVCKQKKTIIEKTNIFFREHFTQLLELLNIFQSLLEKVHSTLNHRNNLLGSLWSISELIRWQNNFPFDCSNYSLGKTRWQVAGTGSLASKQDISDLVWGLNSFRCFDTELGSGAEWRTFWMIVMWWLVSAGGTHCNCNLSPCNFGFSSQAAIITGGRRGGRRGRGW